MATPGGAGAMSHAARLELSSSPAAARVLAAASSALRRRGTLLAGGALLLILAELPAAALPHIGQPLAMVLALVTLLLQLAVGSWLRAGVLRAHRAVLTGER